MMGPPRPLVLAACALAAGCGLSEFPVEGAAGVDAARPDATKAPTSPTVRDATVSERSAPPPDDQAADAAVVPPAGDQVTIDGVPVARENVIVFLHLGHSNMAG